MAGHDHADVAGAQDDETLPGHIALYIDQALGRARRIHARRPAARDGQGAPGSLPAAHGQDEGLGGDAYQALTGVGGDEGQGVVDRQDHGLGEELYVRVVRPVHPAGGVLGSREVLLEYLQPETVVNALGENASQLPAAFHHEDSLRTALTGPIGGGQPCRPAAYDRYITGQGSHDGTSLVLRSRKWEPSPCFVISRGEISSSRAMISMTRGVSKAP